MPIEICFDPDGSARAIYDDEFRGELQAAGFTPPQRASHVETITSGPHAWFWSVDLSPCGEDFQFCLWPPSETREAALRAEHEYIQEHWVSPGAAATKED